MSEDSELENSWNIVALTPIFDGGTFEVNALDVTSLEPHKQINSPPSGGTTIIVTSKFTEEDGTKVTKTEVRSFQESPEEVADQIMWAGGPNFLGEPN